MQWKVIVGAEILLLLLLSSSVKSDDGEKRVVCYYTNWSVYRPGTAKFLPENINPYLCTHLIYAFGGFTKDDILKPFDKYQDVDKSGYAKFNGLKTYNKELKTLLAIGGWNEGSSRFSPMVANPERRRKFVKNAVRFLRQNQFDGLDLDWEYPAHRDGGKPRDKENYANLVQELREEFEKESSKTKKPRLLLTMAVPAGIEYIDKGYDIPRLNEFLDFINLLSYDYHSAYEPAVNHHAPLYPLEEDNEYNYDNELTIDYSIKHLIKSGASSEKIVVGIPTYGRSYTLFNEDANALGSPADGPGAEGDATREKGYLAYYEICEGVMKDEWDVEKPNPKAMGPYAYNKNQWVGYDDEDIVREKAKYVNKNNLGGIMFWSIDNDDFRGKCHGRPYPLIEAAKEALLDDNKKRKDEERPNTISSRKRNRVTDSSKSNSQSNSRKPSNSSSRKNSLPRSTTGKRASGSTKSRRKSSSRTASSQISEDEANDENAETSENVETTRPPNKSSRSQVLTNKNRFRTRLSTSERGSRKKQSTEPPTTQRTHNNKLTTPEPPTTPDPGSDFKCEDEGFFPHPRDCKKYFWCLDSGPSGLGIVANQFTCPSGLVFNKLADSCDYPRNVVCPKNKGTATTTTTTSTTTQRTTTEKEKDEVIEEEDEEEDEEYEEEEDAKEIEEEKPEKVSTTSKPLLYKTISRSRPSTTTSTTTTTSAPSSTISSARSGDEISDEEQDPKVIKELIDLIKKAGGIEQLEKQLAHQEKSTANAGDGKSTPATISKSLYERVLSRQSGRKNFLGLPSSRSSNSRRTDEVEDAVEDDEEEEEEKKTSRDKPSSRFKSVNGPGRSQFEGLDEVPEVKSLRRSNKPKYVTIERHSTPNSPKKDDDEADEDEEEEVDADNEDVASSEEKLISNIPEEKHSPTQRSTSGYVNIRRSKPTTTTELSRSDNDIKEADIVSKENYNTKKTSSRPAKVTNAESSEESITTPKTRYVSVNRFRSTTITPQKEIEQTSIESSSLKPVTTTQIYKDDYVTDGKTITIAGESGRISITPFTTDAPSTARLFADDFSSTLKSVSPIYEEKFISTQYSTKRLEATTTPIPKTEEVTTESLLTIAPTESSTKETIAVVSQPRPFGFPRRTRPTQSTSSVSDGPRFTTAVTTARSKVFDELIHHPVSENFTSHKVASNSMIIDPKITSVSNRTYEKPETVLGEISFDNKHLSINDSYTDINNSVNVPVRFVDGPEDEFFLIQIPKSRLNMSGVGSIFKIEVVKTTENYIDNVNNDESSESTDPSTRYPVLQREPYEKEISSKVSDTNIPKPIIEFQSKITNSTKSIGIHNATVFTQEGGTSIPQFETTPRDSNFVNNKKSGNPDPKLKKYLNRNEVPDTIGNDMKEFESAINNLQNSRINNERPIFNSSTANNNQLSINNGDSAGKKKVHRQRVLVYRGSSNHQLNSIPQRKWIMKKVVRKRVRRTKLNSPQDLDTSATSPVAGVKANSSEVKTSRNPGLSLFRRPGDPLPPRGAYTSVSPVTLFPTTLFYPVQIGIENTRVVGITADQSGNPQNLELILADPPASVSSTTDSGRAALTRPSFRRKISTTLSPRPSEEYTSSTSPSRIISPEKRHQGQKYDSYKTASQNSYQIQSRPYKPAVTDYDYYEDEEERFNGKPLGKLLINSKGFIKCLDQGNFPHPESCKKFISCAKMVNGIIVGTEYTCPSKLSFDPIGGMCNWSAGIGCAD